MLPTNFDNFIEKWERKRKPIHQILVTIIIFTVCPRLCYIYFSTVCQMMLEIRSTFTRESQHSYSAYYIATVILSVRLSVRVTTRYRLKPKFDRYFGFSLLVEELTGVAMHPSGIKPHAYYCTLGAKLQKNLLTKKIWDTGCLPAVYCYDNRKLLATSLVCL